MATTNAGLRVALFSDTYLPQTNGVSRTLGRLVGHLSHRGHEVALVSPRLGADQAEGTTLHCRVSGVPFPLYPELLLTRTPPRRQAGALEEFDPHVVHCATESVLGWWGRKWAMRTDRPLVTSFHTNFPAYAAEYRLGFLNGTAWRLLVRFHDPAFATLCPSRTTLEELRDRGFHDRVAIWSRGVDSGLFSPERRSQEVRERLAPGAEVVLLFVGRLAAEKRLDVLMEAWALLRARTSRRVTLLLVGDGPLGPELRKRNQPNVRLTGYLKGTELAAAYAAADIFAFPSDTETFGNVVTEAMASGIPVVGVAQGGVRDTVRHGVTGLLAPARDPAAFAERLLFLVEDDVERAEMGRRARLDAEGRNWETILDGVVDVYRGARRTG